MKVKKIKTATQILFLIAWAFSTLLFSLSAHSFEFQDYEKKIKNGYSLRSAVEKMPKSQLEDTLRQFVASGRPNRLLGTPGHDKAREFIESKLKSFSNVNASFKTQEFSAEGKKGVNLIWQKKGSASPNEIIILGANYDTLLKDQKTKQPVLKGEMPGADNNASGVAILLSMAEVLNKLEIPKTVILVFFDAEEFHAQGSKEFTSSTWEGKTFGFINVTMVGHDSKINDVEKRMNNMSIYIKPRDQAGADVDLAFAKYITETGKRNYSTVEFFQKETFSGDYFPNTAQNFWAKGIPAVTMTQNREGDLNPRFMTSNDFPETLNFNTYTNVFRYIMSVVLSWEYDIVK